MGKTIKGKIELKAKKKMRNAMGGMAITGQGQKKF